MPNSLNMYMGFSRSSGSHEGAILIFAVNSRQARKIGWGKAWGMIVDDYADFTVTRINDAPWLYEEAVPDKLRDGIPHVIDNPTVCKSCEQWGEWLIDGKCQQCTDNEDSEWREDDYEDEPEKK